jgi:hypothetical protein
VGGGRHFEKNEMLVSFFEMPLNFLFIYCMIASQNKIKKSPLVVWSLLLKGNCRA